MEEEEALYRSPSPHPEGGSSRRGSFVFTPLALRHPALALNAPAPWKPPPTRLYRSLCLCRPPLSLCLSSSRHSTHSPLRRVSSRAPPLYWFCYKPAATPATHPRAESRGLCLERYAPMRVYASSHGRVYRLFVYTRARDIHALRYASIFFSFFFSFFLLVNQQPRAQLVASREIRGSSESFRVEILWVRWFRPMNCKEISFLVFGNSMSLCIVSLFQHLASKSNRWSKRSRRWMNSRDALNNYSSSYNCTLIISNIILPSQ